jgi:hypothetical protein
MSIFIERVSPDPSPTAADPTEKAGVPVAPAGAVEDMAARPPIATMIATAQLTLRISPAPQFARL